jgi:predicted PurR-regulated permease PerM
MREDSPPPPLPPRSDLTQTTLGVLFIGALLVGSLWVLRPFLAALVWAATVTISTWPVLLWLQRRLWNRRGLAVLAMTLLLLLVFVVPLTAAVLTLLEQQERIMQLVLALTAMDWKAPPAWLAALPWVGASLASAWAQLADTGLSALAARVTPYVDDVVGWLLTQLGNVGLMVVHVLLTVAIAAWMYASGESIAAWFQRFGWRLAGERGTQAVTLSAQAIRGVAMGVVITALVQAALGGIGVAIAGVPAASALAAAMLILCIAQLGPLLVLLPATAWVFYTGDTTWGVFLLVWSLVVGTIDNVLRPVLIRRGADLPMLLILAGVIGGLFAFGLIGIFVGPVILAVTYTLVDHWIGAAQPRV